MCVSLFKYIRWTFIQSNRLAKIKSRPYVWRMKLAYGFKRREADFPDIDPRNIFIDMSRERPLRDDLLLAARPGDEVVVLFLRDLGGSPKADPIWKAKVEATGATVTEIRPETPTGPIGRPRKWKPTPDEETAVRNIWLGGGSEIARLRRCAEKAGQELGKGLLVGRFGVPSNPKQKEG